MVEVISQTWLQAMIRIPQDPFQCKQRHLSVFGDFHVMTPTYLYNWNPYTGKAFYVDITATERTPKTVSIR